MPSMLGCPVACGSPGKTQENAPHKLAASDAEQAQGG